MSLSSLPSSSCRFYRWLIGVRVMTMWGLHLTKWQLGIFFERFGNDREGCSGATWELVWGQIRPMWVGEWQLAWHGIVQTKRWRMLVIFTRIWPHLLSRSLLLGRGYKYYKFTSSTVYGLALHVMKMCSTCPKEYLCPQVEYWALFLA
jgi:hypothetical protein